MKQTPLNNISNSKCKHWNIYNSNVFDAGHLISLILVMYSRRNSLIIWIFIVLGKSLASTFIDTHVTLKLRIINRTYAIFQICLYDTDKGIKFRFVLNWIYAIENRSVIIEVFIMMQALTRISQILTFFFHIYWFNKQIQ